MKTEPDEPPPEPEETPPESEELRKSAPAARAIERIDAFRDLDRDESVEFFLSCSPFAQAKILEDLPESQRRLWMRALEPDDAADVVQQFDDGETEEWLALLDEPTEREVRALLRYEAESAGGLMNPRFARLGPDMSVDGAIRYLRQQAREHLETIYYIYVVDESNHLEGVVSFREIFEAEPDQKVGEIMQRDVVSVPESMDQEEVATLFDVADLIALPVVDEEDRIQGIVTFDDIVDVVREEATEDVQKIGGMEAMKTPYLETSFWGMMEKRGGWLSVLFVGEMFTASAMAVYEEQLANAVVLSVFMPLIIASGGNSGSQASTLVIRALAVGDLDLVDWWRVAGRELLVGVGLGAVLALLGWGRVLSWEWLFGSYGAHASLLAATVGISLIGVVTWGTVVGSLLPFLLEKVGLDPASASAPLVATIVDVSGLVIYFSVAKLLLTGTML